MEFFLTTFNPIFAYIDPGTGSLIIQLIMGAVLAAGIFIKTSWKKLKGFFSKKQS